MSIVSKLALTTTAVENYSTSLSGKLNGVNADLDAFPSAFNETPFFSEPDTPLKIAYGYVAVACEFIDSDAELVAASSDPDIAQAIDLRDNMLYRRVNPTTMAGLGPYTSIADFYRGRYYYGKNGRSRYYLLNGSLVSLIP